MAELEILIGHYGIWLGFGLYIFFKDIWPLIFKKLIPARIKAAENERVAKIKELEDLRSWQRKMDAERVIELRNIASATQSMNLNLVRVNVEIANLKDSSANIVDNQRTIMEKQDIHHNATMQAVSDMRAVVAKREGKEDAADNE